MKHTLRHTTLALLAAICLPLLCACDNEDDVTDIFTGKVWKLNRLNTEGNSGQFLSLWNNENSYRQSMNALAEENNYTIEFYPPENNLTGGRFTAHGIRATVNGYWTADGSTRTLSVSAVRVSGSESDPLAKEFVNGLQKLSAYEGDTRTLTLRYTEGQTTRIIGLTHR